MLSPNTQSPSLRALLYLGLGSLGLVFMGTAIWMASYLDGRVTEQAEAQVRALSRHRAQQALLMALLEQESGLRGYLATGDSRYLDSYQQGLRNEQEAQRNTLDNLPPDDAAAVEIPFQRLQESVKVWHEQVTPLMAARGKGLMGNLNTALDMEKKHFEAVRFQSEAMGRLLDDRDNARLTLLEQALANARWISSGVIAIVLLLGFVIARWIIRRVVVPLVELSEFAREENGFPEPGGILSVREVDILGKALHELDLRARDRAQTLKEEHEYALHAQDYMSLLQQFSKEEEVLQAFEQVLRRMLRPDELRILLRPEGKAILESKLMFPEEWISDPPRVLAEPMGCRAIRQGSPVHLGTEDPTACICTLGVPKRGTYFCLPLIASGQVLGIVNLQSRQTDRWSVREVRLASTLTSGTAATLQLIRALEAAQDLAVRDGLTGIHNRRFLNEVLTKLVDQAHRKSRAISALMLDIDHFKRFNDQFGHEVGDRVLVETARCAQNALRAGDLVARYGGEEFAALLPDTDHDDALMLAERLRASLENLILPEPEFPKGSRITMSIGVATLPDHAMDGDGLLSMADKALYEAKGCGRNRVVGASELGTGLHS